MTTRGDLALGILAGVGASADNGKLAAVMAWCRSEFGTLVPLPFSYNLLATTMQEPGSTAGNSAGVQSYPDEATGVHAVVATLLEDHPGYAEIVDLLRTSSDPHAICAAVRASVWGSQPTDELVSETEANLLFYVELRADAPTPGHQSGEPAPGPVGHVAMPTIQQGSTGDAVRDVQAILHCDVDGVFGPQTEQYVHDFQTFVGIGVDGIVGPQTWTALAQHVTGATVDGVYGPETTAKVSAWQQTHGLVVDGIAGPATFASLAGA